MFGYSEESSYLCSRFYEIRARNSLFNNKITFKHNGNKNQIAARRT